MDTAEPSGLSRVAASFARAVASPDEELDLALASLAIAQAEYADLVPRTYVLKLDGLGYTLKDRLGDQRNPYAVIGAINTYLFGELGFKGNIDQYYDPRNTFLNDVLDRRLGIPITLSTIYMELGRRIGFPFGGVGLPGHFLIKCPEPYNEVFVDPFNNGAILSADDCAELVRRVSGGQVEFQEHFLATVTKKQMLARMLNNLKGVYLSTQQYPKALVIVQLLLTLSPWALTEIRDRGMIRSYLRDYEGGLGDLETYLQYCPAADDADVVRHNIDSLKRLLGRQPR